MEPGSAPSTRSLLRLPQWLLLQSRLLAGVKLPPRKPSAMNMRPVERLKRLPPACIGASQRYRTNTSHSTPQHPTSHADRNVSLVKNWKAGEFLSVFRSESGWFWMGPIGTAGSESTWVGSGQYRWQPCGLPWPSQPSRPSQQSQLSLMLILRPWSFQTLFRGADSTR